MAKYGPSLEGRPEYKDGTDKLNFEYKFSNNDRLQAAEDSEGIAGIVLQRDGKSILDFHDLVPTYQFVTPTHLAKHAPHETYKIHAGSWGSFENQSKILIGDMQDARSIFPLLHEIGHGRRAIAGIDGNITARWAAKTALSFARKNAEDSKALVKELSEMERGANVEALKIARETKASLGTNLLEGFASFRDLQEYMYTGLLSHRIGKGETMISADRKLMQEISSLVMLIFGVKEDHSEQWQYLGDLFDKGKLYDKKG